MNLSMVSILLLMTWFSPQYVNKQSSLQIEVLNIQQNKGKIIIEIYKDKDTWLKEPYQKITLPSKESSTTASFNIPQGRYAVSVYQDTNGNNKIDQNFLGIPKEPIGFGNNYKPFGKPKFESALIDYGSAAKPNAIKLYTVF